MSDSSAKKPRRWIVASAILCIAIGLIFFLSSSWIPWARNGEEQKTDDADLRADITPPGTKAAELVASAEQAHMLASAELQQTIERTPGS
jgi:hypothetical protein